MIERRRTPEEEKKRRLLLSRYSVNVSKRILTQEGSHPLGQDIPADVLAAFQGGSLSDRDGYWQEQQSQGKKLNFGQELITWIAGDREKPGIRQWVAKQTDIDVIHILQAVGLHGSIDQTQQELQDPKVISLIATINNDLQAIGGERPLSQESIDNDFARMLIFYATYLSPTDKSGNDTKKLIDTLVEAASRESNGDPEKIIDNLQRVAPLLQVAGEKAQHALGALLVAKTRALHDQQALEQVTPDATLNEDESTAWEWLQKHREQAERPQALEKGKPHNVKDVLARLQPPAQPGNPYWLEKGVPVDFAQNLTFEQLKELQLRKNFFVLEPDGEHLFPNEEVFPPARVLEENKRFKNAEALTDNDSGTFALAAASAESPEEQAMLYQQIGETILRVHEVNPQLLQEFFEAQTPDSLRQFAFHDLQVIEPQLIGNNNEEGQVIQIAFQQQFHREYAGLQENLSSEEQDFIEEQLVPFIQKEQAILHDVSTPNRLVAIDSVEPTINEEVVVDELFPYTVNTEQTLAVWPERRKALEEVLKIDPLTLTPEQIRQIEFLGHSVDIKKVMEMLKGEEIILPMQVEAPVVEQEVVEQATAAMPEVVELPKSITLTSLFEQLDDPTKTPVSEGTLPRREGDFAVVDPSLMSPISLNEDIEHFEVTDNRGELGLFTIGETDSRSSILYNMIPNSFIARVREDNTLSQFSFNQLESSYHGPNTLFSYVYEATVHPTHQARLVRNLFGQVSSMYQQYPDAVPQIGNYFTNLNQQVPNAFPQERIEQLFGNREEALKRVQSLHAKLETNQELSAEDIYDLGLYSLPFNLQHIAKRMENAYDLTNETNNTTTPDQ